ncbi:MAG: DUF4270 domain-containing protein [Burkholderiales bacterium]|nr:DUF4270 domain-containing protein [Flavobacterium sp.]
MNKVVLKKHLLLAVAFGFLASCDSNFNELGTDIVGVDNFGFESQQYTVNTTNVSLGALESNNLPVNPLGIYNSPVFGLTRANFVTQVQLASVNPAIDPLLHPIIENVVLTIPYFNTKLTAFANDVAGTYKLDSIYGPEIRSKFILDVYESGYFLRDLNPLDQLQQAYYNDQDADFNAAKIGSSLNTGIASQNTDFVFSNLENSETTTVNGTETTTRNAGMKLNLSTVFFKTKILEAQAGKLLNNNVFKDYFRGLYFSVAQIPGEEGNLAMINFQGGKITINYKEDLSLTDATEANRVSKSIVLNLTGNTVSLVEQGTPAIVPDSRKLVLKGGANSSMAVIDLFSAGELQQLRDDKWLINDASLTFTIDNTQTGMDAGSTKAVEPNRVYLYDLNNKRPIVDYSLDASANSAKPKFGKTLFGGIIKKDATARGTTYKIRLTKHVLQMVKLDSTNVRLGLVVTEDINNVANKRLKSPVLAGTIKAVPLMSVVHPLGTILFGSDEADASKRPRFEIYYTKPKQN